MMLRSRGNTREVLDIGFDDVESVVGCVPGSVVDMFDDGELLAWEVF